MQAIQNEVKALLFDTWGTVVDWRSTVLDELRAFGQRHRLSLPWEEFVAQWRADYHPAMEKINSGERPWTRMDLLYREALDRLVARYKITGVSESELQSLNLAWTRNRPWPDSVPGMLLLRRRFLLSPLSNASFAWLTDIARFANLPFDCILSAENARWYKPRPEAYLTALELLDLKPEQAMLVAAHNYDLAAARKLGMRTAFIPRPTEFGPGQTKDLRAEQDWEVVAEDMIDLAKQLGVA